MTVQQPGASPWLMRFPAQPTGPGSAATPIDVEAVCGLRGCGKPRWVRPDGSLSEACCQEHVRLLAVARRDVRGGGLDSPSHATPAVVVPPVVQQAGAPISPVVYRAEGVDPNPALCALEECMRPRYRLADGTLMDCCGITHGRELLSWQARGAGGTGGGPA